MVLDNNSGEIVRTDFFVEGRKQPLLEIRENVKKPRKVHAA